MEDVGWPDGIVEGGREGSGGWAVIGRGGRAKFSAENKAGLGVLARNGPAKAKKSSENSVGEAT